MSEFTSPLLVHNPGALDRIDFGRPPPDPAIDALGARLDATLRDTAAALPEPLRAEADATLSGYCRGRADFIALFYRPVWSFLHWVPLPDPALHQAACRLQAAALFLHLWDDHISDGQLAPDLMRLHLRSLVWQAFDTEARRLCAAAGLPHAAIARPVGEYLAAVHRPGQVATLPEHADRMVRQVGIWRIGPTLVGQLASGPAGAAALCRIVERFSVAWRLVDDIQDAAQDVRGIQQNALHLALDPPGRAAWAECARRSAAALDPDAWARLLPHLEAALPAVLARVDAELAAARDEAEAHGWPGLAAELAASRITPTA